MNNLGRVFSIIGEGALAGPTWGDMARGASSAIKRFGEEDRTSAMLATPGLFPQSVTDAERQYLAQNPQLAQQVIGGAIAQRLKPPELPGGGITPYQQGQLALGRDRLAFERERLEHERSGRGRPRFEVRDVNGVPMQVEVGTGRHYPMPGGAPLAQDEFEVIDRPDGAVWQRNRRTGRMHVVQPALRAAGGRGDPYAETLARERAKRDAVQAETERLRSTQSENIGNLLSQLWSMPERDRGFDYAVGPLQSGQGVVGGVGGALSSAANSFGSLNDRALSQVRSDIDSAEAALRTALIPLIRPPGSGTWTDNDQAQLNALVGDLKSARNGAEFRERLAMLRQRLNAGYGLAIPDSPVAAPSASSAAPRSTATRLRYNPETGDIE